MDCPSARGEIPALIQGELADDARRPLEDHLRACPACAAEERDELSHGGGETLARIGKF